MQRPNVTGKTLTREGLREILKVNFQLYKDEPDFFDYVTTLVIYLMQYEYCDEPQSNADADATAVPEPSRLQKFNAIATRYKVQEGSCPQCNNPVPKDRNICPFCLSMVEH